MRHRFIIQIPLGAVAIEDIELDLTSRHELVPILMALQHLYVHRKDTLYIFLGLIDADMRRGRLGRRLGSDHRKPLGVGPPQDTDYSVFTSQK